VSTPAEHGRYHRFPGRRGQVVVPTSSRRAALAALALYAPCRPIPEHLHGLICAAVRLLGTGVLRGGTSQFPAPVAPAEWDQLTGSWNAELGAFDEVALCQRPQAARAGCALLLLRAGRALAFVKVMPAGTAALNTERTALQHVSRSSWKHFVTPEPIASGEVAGWGYLALTPLPPFPHRVPRRPPLALLADEVSGALAGMPRPAAVPAHWQGMHGDFAPWNLRRLASGGLVLYDWEEATWGPPGADLAYYQLTARAVGRTGPDSRVDVPPEVAAFWWTRVHRRGSSGPRERALKHCLEAALQRSAAMPAEQIRGGT
jgi:hypothetical protein